MSTADRTDATIVEIAAEAGDVRVTLETTRDITSREIVERCEEFARAQRFIDVRLTDLCRVAAASERRIRRAFVDVHAMPPTQRLRRMALDDVRGLLAATPTSRSSVSEAAASRGFQNFGRFAANYRRRFGENPSETLRAVR